jgi:BlaI family transcriptional regulator, penicillinase repressor
LLRNISYISIARHNMTNKKRSGKPTEAELEILQVLWEGGPQTVRSINDKMSVGKKVGYTTTLKLLQIMTEKGLTLRDETGRTHIYSSAAGREETRSQLLDRFVDTAFGGSAMSLVMQALGNHRASEEEMKQIRELLSRMEETDHDRDS